MEALRGGGATDHRPRFLREELERIWEAWVRILKNMPAEIGEPGRQLEGGEGAGGRALSGRSGTADNIGGVVSYW